MKQWTLTNISMYLMITLSYLVTISSETILYSNRVSVFKRNRRTYSELDTPKCRQRHYRKYKELFVDLAKVKFRSDQNARERNFQRKRVSKDISLKYILADYVPRNMQKAINAKISYIFYLN